MSQGEPSSAVRDLGGGAELGSRRAWLVVVGGFLSTFTVFGVAYSFGAFFQAMSAEFDATSSATSLVFSITAFLYFTLGAVSGRVADRFGPRPVLAVGTAAMTVGLWATSQVDSLAAGYVTYGLGVGLGVACGYVPIVSTVGAWFEDRRSLALGVTVSGIGVGTLVVSPLAGALIADRGWRDTYLVFAVGAVVLMTIASFLVAPPPQTTRPEVGGLRRSVRTNAFVALYVSGLLLSLALFVPFVFLPAFARSVGVGDVAAAALVGIIGGASVVGRLALGGAADRIGSVRTYQACFGVMGASYLIWLLSSSLLWLAVFAVVMGVAYGGFIALSPAVTAELFGVRGLGGLLGISYTAAAIGGLAGPPAAGALIDATGSYRWAIAAAMLVGLAAFAVTLLLNRPDTTDPWPDRGERTR